MTAPRAHVCVVQPRGYLHSLGLLDPALYLRHQLERIGVEVTLGKNRLRRDAVNYVLGAHLGFDRAWAEEFACVMVNLEQLGAGGAGVTPEYLRLLAEHEVLDYHPDNVAAYRPAPGDRPQEVSFLELGHAGYLAPADGGTGAAAPLAERPIDLLFVGSMNERRQRLVERIEAAGAQVAMFDSPVYGPERDAFIRRSKAVLNLAFYETARFEQVRAGLVLSCGTALVSERRPLRSPGEQAYSDLVLWFEPGAIEEFFGGYLRSEAFLTDAAGCLERFRGYDPLACVESFWARHRERLGPAVAPSASPSTSSSSPPPRVRLALDCARTGYRPGWLNVADAPVAAPDWLADLRRPLALPADVETARWGRLRLEAGAVAQVDLGPLEPADPQLGTLLATTLELLDDGGTAVLRWPAAAGREPLDRVSTRFWEAGLLEHRFDVRHVGPLDERGAPCAREQAVWLRVVLARTACTLAERTLARAAREDFALVEPGGQASVGPGRA